MAVGTTNLTLRLPKRTLAQLKQIAARRNTSVSRLLLDALDEIVRHETEYERARQRQMALMESAPELGTYGKSPASRDEIHER
jgi:predicted transcriptional regulator